MCHATRTRASLPAAVLLVLWMATACPAGVVFQRGNHPQPDAEDVLFASPAQGRNITGTTSLTNAGVLFASGQTLAQQSPGPADIRALDPSTGGLVPLQAMRISMPDGSFTGAVVNLHIGEVPPVDLGLGAAFTVDANEPGGGTLTRTFIFRPEDPGGWVIGDNFLTVAVTDGDTIAMLSVTAIPGFSDLLRPRLSGVRLNPPPVPEPSGLILAALASGGLAVRAWRWRVAG